MPRVFAYLKEQFRNRQPWKNPHLALVVIPGATRSKKGSTWNLEIYRREISGFRALRAAPEMTDLGGRLFSAGRRRGDERGQGTHHQAGSRTRSQAAAIAQEPFAEKEHFIAGAVDPFRLGAKGPDRAFGMSAPRRVEGPLEEKWIGPHFPWDAQRPRRDGLRKTIDKGVQKWSAISVKPRSICRGTTSADLREGYWVGSTPGSGHGRFLPVVAFIVGVLWQIKRLDGSRSANTENPSGAEVPPVGGRFPPISREAI